LDGYDIHSYIIKRVQHIKIEYNFIGDIYIPDELQKETA